MKQYPSPHVHRCLPRRSLLLHMQSSRCRMLAARRTSLEDGGFLVVVPNLGALLRNLFFGPQPFFLILPGGIWFLRIFDAFYLHIPGTENETKATPAYYWKCWDPRSLQIPVRGEPPGPRWADNIAPPVQRSQLLACIAQWYLISLWHIWTISFPFRTWGARYSPWKLMHSDLQRPWHMSWNLRTLTWWWSGRQGAIPEDLGDRLRSARGWWWRSDSICPSWFTGHPQELLGLFIYFFSQHPLCIA